jgi:large subunit ribosomal protein L9
MAIEEVILKQDVRSLGDRGQIVKVAAGYARNYLFPRSLALPATNANKKQIDEMRAAAAKEAARLRNDASKLASTMTDLTIRLVAKAGDTNVLFGSIGVRDIAEGLEAQGFPIDRHRILLDKPIKEVGDYPIRIHLYKDVKQTIKVEVRAEGREDEPLEKPKAQAGAEEAEAAADEAQETVSEEIAAIEEAVEDEASQA